MEDAERNGGSGEERKAEHPAQEDYGGRLPSRKGRAEQEVEPRLLIQPTRPFEVWAQIYRVVQ
jgi:hypothetical protein